MLPTTGLGSVTMSRSRASSLVVPAFMPPCLLSVRSAPAQNAGPVWVSSTACTASSAPASASAWVSCSIRAADSAFLLRGESSAILAIPRSTEDCTSRSDIPSLPGDRCGLVTQGTLRCLIGLRQAKRVLRDEVQDHLAADRRDPGGTDDG